MQKPISTKDQEDTLAAYQEAGTIAGAAHLLGLSRTTMQSRIKVLKNAGVIGVSAANEPEFSYPEIPPVNLSVEDLVARRKLQYEQKKKHEDASKLIPVKINLDGPIGILHFGDPHCFTEAHEVLTMRGWLHQADLQESDRIAGVDSHGAFTYQPILEIIRREVTDEDLVVCRSETAPFECTTKHRFLAEKAVSKGYGERRFWKASEMVDSQFRIPLAAWGASGGSAPITDDEIRLLSWLITDASWVKKGHEFKSLTIHQSKPETVERIRGLLEGMDVEHSEYVRTKRPERARNGVVIRHNHDSHDFRLGLESAAFYADKFGLSERYLIPECFKNLSDAQFAIALEEIALADGEHPSKNTIRIYKCQELVDWMQTLALKHGHKTKMVRHDRYASLTVTVGQTFGVIVPKRNITQSTYTGLVWCVRVPSENFFTRHNGVAYLSGNCDDDGTDIGALEAHSKLVRDTKGMFGGNIGDTTNNWVGRLARLYAQQSTSASEAWQLAEWFIEGVDWLYLIGGNHDCWSGDGDPIKFIQRGGSAPYLSSEARLDLRFPNGRGVRINARHDFAGHSQYNPAHGVTKAIHFGVRDHIAIAGHKHTSGYNIIKDPTEGIACHAIRVASYKVFDRFAKERGFPDQAFGPCCVTVIDPKLPNAHPDLVKVFWDPFEGADYLNFKRSKK
jgi:hypothetical protein